MMHYDKTVVTVCALPGKRTLREYDHVRQASASSATVVLPFGSEYGIHFKFQDSTRRRIELWIDGVEVTHNLIVEGEEILERFVDSDKRFKFVEAANAAVMDPTSPDNGNITIKLYKERVSYRICGAPWPDSKRSGQHPWPNPIRHDYVPPVTMNFMGDVTMTSNCAPSAPTGSIIRSMSCNSIPCSSEVGATVEGSKSHQHIGTTSWAGDEPGSCQTFMFRLRGKAVERYTICSVRSCGTENPRGAKFCSECGSPLQLASV